MWGQRRVGCTVLCFLFVALRMGLPTVAAVFLAGCCREGWPLRGLLLAGTCGGAFAAVYMRLMDVDVMNMFV